MVYGQTQSYYLLDFDASSCGFWRVCQSRLTVASGQAQDFFDFLELLFSFEDLLSSFVESIWGEQLLWSQGKPFGFLVSSLSVESALKKVLADWAYVFISCHSLRDLSVEPAGKKHRLSNDTES